MIDISEIDENGLEDILSEPAEATKKIVAGLTGDIAVLGAGGKMGPTLAMMLKKASPGRKIYAVSRFSDKAARSRIEQAQVETIEADLLDESHYYKLPDVENVFYLAGMKFGSTGNQPLTWALNSFVPALVARHYKHSRIVAYSTGNVYPLVDIAGGGATEQTTPKPIGEYAQSCLGRERVFGYFAERHSTGVCVIRLNYAVEARYGVLLDIARRVFGGEPVQVGMGRVNLIWQGDANSAIFRSLALAGAPAQVLNVTGMEILSVRTLAEELGRRLGRRPRCEGTESETALLSDASLCRRLLGLPRVPLGWLLDLVADWVIAGRPTYAKPTKFEVRDGRF